MRANLDKCASVFWVILGALVAIHSTRLGIGNLNEPGPGFIFFAAGLFLSILGIVDLVINAKKSGETEITIDLLWGGKNWWKIIIVIAYLCLFLGFFDKLGFALSSFLLIIFLLKVSGSISWGKIILFALSSSIMGVLVFRYWLQVPFPRGIIGM
jgi:hypothetical protein